MEKIIVMVDRLPLVSKIFDFDVEGLLSLSFFHIIIEGKVY
jgi:hypothetical protein